MRAIAGGATRAFHQSAGLWPVDPMGDPGPRDPAFTVRPQCAGHPTCRVGLGLRAAAVALLALALVSCGPAGSRGATVTSPHASSSLPHTWGDSPGQAASPAFGPPSSIAGTLDPFNGSLIPGRFDPPVPGAINGGAFDPASGQVFVGDAGGSDVFAFNGSTGRGVAAISGGFNPYHDNSDPSQVVDDPGRGLVYAAVGTSGRIAVINASDDRLVETIDGLCGANDLAFDPVNGLIYVTTCGGNLTLVNVSTGQVLSPTIPICADPWAALWDPANQDVYIACVDTEEILVISTATQAVVKHLLIGGSSLANIYPMALAFDAKNRDVYVANNQASNVSIIDSATNAFVGAVATHGHSPSALAVDPAIGAVLVATYPSGVLVINDTNQSLAGTAIPTGDTPVALVYDPSAQLVYSVNQGTETLTSFTADRLTVVSPSVPLMFRMLRATYDPQNGGVYVATPDENFACVEPGSLLAFNTTGPLPAMEPSITVGYGPEATVVEPASGRLFAANFCSANVTAVNGTSDRTLPALLPVGPGADSPRRGSGAPPGLRRQRPFRERDGNRLAEPDDR
jgi:YVTN family beta-propeller protein